MKMEKTGVRSQEFVIELLTLHHNSCFLNSPFMSDRRRFFKHTLIYGVGGSIEQLVPFLLLPLYTNYLTPGEYGMIDVIIVASIIFNTVFLVEGIRLAAMTFYKQAESEEERRRIAVTISTLLWFFIAIAITLSICFVDVVDLFLKTGEKKLLTFGMAATLLEALVAVPKTLMQARLESLRFVFTNIAMGFSRLGLCIYFVAGLHWGIWGFLYAQAIVTCVFSVYLTYRELRIGSLYPDISKWKEIMRFALPLVPSGIVAFLFSMASRFSILNFGHYESGTALGAVGLYALARRLMSVSEYMGPLPMQQVWTAEMYDVYKNPDASHGFGNFMLRLLCVKVFAVLFISLFAVEIVRSMCDPSFHKAATFIPLFGIYYALDIFNRQMRNTFYITRKTNYLLFCNGLTLPFVFLLMYFFVPRWGVAGAIIALILIQIVYTGVVYFFSQRFFYIRYPFGKMAMLLAITVLCYGMSLLCGNGIEQSPLTPEQFKELTRWEKIIDAWDRIRWLSIILKLGMMCLWGVLIWFSGILSREDKALVIRVLKKGLEKNTPV